MILYDLEDRLVATNDDATKAVVWNGTKWAETGGDFPRKAWLEGEEISPGEAEKRFPEAKLDELPELVD